jgi:spore maturation protein CgeB
MPYYTDPVDGTLCQSSSTEEDFHSDVAFVGHYERDGRERVVLALIESGLNVRIWGDQTWQKLASPRLLNAIPPIRYASSVDYSRLLLRSKVALAFLSRRNRDVYTRRNFEIPAHGVAMLSQHTEELDTLFVNGEGALLFRTTTEAVDMAWSLVQNAGYRERIANVGRNVVVPDHSVRVRAHEFVLKVAEAVGSRHDDL